MCNLAGAVGSRKPVLNKLQLLGIYGIARGKHSCGMTWNNKIFKGTGQHSDFDDFLKEMTFDKKTTNNVSIIHNRSATSGAWYSAENAHPFGYVGERGEEEEKPPYHDFIFMHNGTLKDWRELAEKYGENAYQFSVDSKMLGHLIFKHGFDVLKHYKGAAACAFYWTDKPNELWLWKGASRQVEDGPLVDERPLHYYYDKMGRCFYFNSLDAPLKVINNGQYEIHEVPQNTLLHFKDSEIIEQIPIDRNIVVNAARKKVWDNWGSHHNGYGINYDKNKNKNKNKNKEKKKDKPRILIERSPQNDAKGKIYHWNGKYFRNGHPCNGVYEVDMETGALKLNGAGTPVYFVDGLWIKNVELYNIITNLKRPPKVGELHGDALCKRSKTMEYYKNGYIAEGTFSNLPFCYFDYKFKNGRLVSFTDTSLAKPKVEDIALRNFNYSWFHDPAAMENRDDANSWHLNQIGQNVDWTQYVKAEDSDDIVAKFIRELDEDVDSFIENNKKNKTVSKEINDIAKVIGAAVGSLNLPFSIDDEGDLAINADDEDDEIEELALHEELHKKELEKEYEQLYSLIENVYVKWYPTSFISKEAQDIKDKIELIYESINSEAVDKELSRVLAKA